MNSDLTRAILGLQVTTTEDDAGWLAFFGDLTDRGLARLQLVTYAHPRPGRSADAAAARTQASWMDPEAPHSAENVDNHPYHAMRFELRKQGRARLPD